MTASSWDVAVIGAGPAGLSAAQAVGAEGLRCLCIDRLGPGGELINIGRLHDCPDLPSETTGADLAAQLTDAVVAVGVELAFGEVRELRRTDHWELVTDGETYAARAVILAAGLGPGQLGVPGEADFEGFGLSRCASCDGPLYQGERVIVAGAGKWALQDAADLAGIAGHVTLISDAAIPRGALAPNVSLMAGRIVALEGARGLEAVVVESGSGRERQAARAVFVQSNRRAALGFAAGIVALDATGRAVVDGGLRTSDPRIYAAGDAGSGAPEQVSAAIADGRRAGSAVARWLNGAARGGEGGE